MDALDELAAQLDNNNNHHHPAERGFETAGRRKKKRKKVALKTEFEGRKKGKGCGGACMLGKRLKKALLEEVSISG